MKWMLVFLVLSMVVFMAQPGECFLGMLVHGLFHGTVRVYDYLMDVTLTILYLSLCDDQTSSVCFSAGKAVHK
uniref:Uncharacterized protein n=1 Tax=Salarias fasciatus TaxID=181472 RepID=A0A672F7C4_SALFA